MTPSEHPLLIDLLAFIEGNPLVLGKTSAIETHLERCLECQLRASRARTPTASDEEPSDQTDVPIVTVSEAWISTKDPVEPRPGQLWTLRWESTTAMGMLLHVFDDDVVLAPVTLDTWMADEYTITISRDWSPLDSAVAVWISLESVVPLFTLDRFLGELDVLDQVPPVRQAFHEGTSPPSHVAVGSPIWRATDERAQYRSELVTELMILSEADWYGEPVSSKGKSLREIVEHLEPAHVSQSLGLSAPATFQLFSGVKRLSDKETIKLAELSGQSEEEIRAAIPPPPLEALKMMNHPRFRPLIEAAASKRGNTPVVQRHILLNEVMGYAARQDNPELPLDWETLIAHQLSD